MPQPATTKATTGEHFCYDGNGVAAATSYFCWNHTLFLLPQGIFLLLPRQHEDEYYFLQGRCRRSGTGDRHHRSCGRRTGATTVATTSCSRGTRCYMHVAGENAGGGGSGGDLHGRRRPAVRVATGRRAAQCFEAGRVAGPWRRDASFFL